METETELDGDFEKPQGTYLSPKKNGKFSRKKNPLIREEQ